ncbi:hypothetical protein E1193_02270 [Micromonospora sp. KC606]|uniref:hypothetical protein n=1 Tax=Micromonospora sp. KC606 TaxID=2530379 RepID=UPI0010524570|nr:hypothetical protein [Micromonospora sp. KC606]TDC85662.1 hypothetical protein E1193_02270 [Micromonospora sp. KC606]
MSTPVSQHSDPRQAAVSPGGSAVIIDTGVGYAPAAYDRVARQLVIVAVNTGAAQTLTFDLSRCAQVTGGTGGVVPRWSAVPAGSDRYTNRQDIRSSKRVLRVPFAAASVQTLQVDNVVV